MKYLVLLIVLTACGRDVTAPMRGHPVGSLIWADSTWVDVQRPIGDCTVCHDPVPTRHLERPPKTLLN